jgi:Tfp pilus assembly protein PilN
MRAINLIPGDARRGGRGATGHSGGSVYVLLGAMAAAVLLLALYFSATNKISDQQAKVTALRSQAVQAQAAAAKLAPYVQFAQLAQARTATIRGIASSRFDWHAALAGLSRVVPANTSLQALSGSVVPGVNITGASGGGNSAELRGAIAAPAFALTGCSDSQVDVARLISRLRLIDGVTRVSLEDSQKAVGASTGTSVSAGGSSGQGCGTNRPTFDLVVFFQPLANAGANGVTSLSTPVSTATSTSGAAATGAAATTSTGGKP